MPTTPVPLRVPTDLLARIDAAAAAEGSNRTQFMLAAALDRLGGRAAPSVPPPPEHDGGRRMMPDGEPDRMPSDALAQRSRVFQEATTAKGGAFNRPSYPTPPKRDAR